MSDARCRRRSHCERGALVTTMAEPLGGKTFERMRTQDPRSFAPPIAHLLGMRAVSFDEGKAVIELDAEKRHANPMGTLHGGVLCDLADLAMGAACYTTLESGESFTTLELKINYLKPIWTGRPTARAHVTKAGRTGAPPEGELLGEKGA